MKSHKAAAAYFVPPQWAVATLAVVVMFMAMYVFRLDWTALAPSYP
jgi:hypothetical protein